MSTRRKINKILKEKNITADIEYDGSGASRDEYGWWTVTINKDCIEEVKTKLGEPEFTGVIEFCEIDDGLEQLQELPSLVYTNRTH